MNIQVRILDQTVWAVLFEWLCLMLYFHAFHFYSYIYCQNTSSTIHMSTSLAVLLLKGVVYLFCIHFIKASVTTLDTLSSVACVSLAIHYFELTGMARLGHQWHCFKLYIGKQCHTAVAMYCGETEQGMLNFSNSKSICSHYYTRLETSNVCLRQ